MKDWEKNKTDIRKAVGRSGRYKEEITVGRKKGGNSGRVRRRSNRGGTGKRKKRTGEMEEGSDGERELETDE